MNVTPLFRKILLALGIGLVLYALAGFLLAPRIVRSTLLSNLDKTLTTRASLGRVRVNPFALSVTLKNLSIPDSTGAAAVGFAKLYVRFNIFSPFFRAWTLDELRIEKPIVNVAVLEDRTLSLMHLMRTPTPAPPQGAVSEPPMLLIRKFRVMNGVASLEDRSREPRLHKGLIPIQIELTDFTTRRDRQNAYSFDASTDLGEILAWSGNFTTRPFTSAGKLSVQRLQARTIETFLGGARPYELTRGTIDFSADYRVDAGVTPVVFGLSNMGVRVRDLALADRATGEETIRAGAIETRGGSVRSSPQIADLGTVAADSLYVTVWADTTGTTNLQRWTQVPPDTAAPWTSRISRLGFQHLGLEYQDRRIDPPAVLHVREARGEIRDFSTAPGTTVPLSAACSLSTDGYATATGTLVSGRGSLDAAVAMSRLAARELTPFISPFARLNLARGTVGAKGRLQFNNHGRSGPLLRFTGDVTSSGFKALDQRLGQEFLSWERVDIKGLEYDFAPARMMIREIVTRKPYIRLVIAPDRTTNIQAIMVPPDSVPTAFRPKPGAPDTIPAAVGLVQIENGSMYFADLSLTPTFSTGIYAMNGAIRELSSARAAHAVIDIKGKVDEQAPVVISGTINPLNSRGLTDVDVSFQNIELTSFTPYSGKFMGYRIRKGKLDVGLKYTIQDRQLKGENKILVRQFTLGEKVESPDATSLPVKFAIALLKDKNGDINLDLPVHGSLDDPKFSLAKIIMKVLVQLVVKAVTSPFKLFGAIFGGDNDEVAPAIQFPYGVADLDTTETKKLDAIRTGMADRPGLKLEIEQSGERGRDSLAILTQRFLERVRTAETGATRERPSDPALIAAAATRAPNGFTASGYASALTAAYTNQFGRPPGVEKPKGNRPRGDGPDSALVAAEAKRLAYMEERVRSSIPVRTEEVTALASDRARRIQGYLLQDSTLAADRLFIVANKGAYPPDSSGVRAGLTLTD
jgi:uncharacterized protein DUF748